jgi:hypothetical protein
MHEEIKMKNKRNKEIVMPFTYNTTIINVSVTFLHSHVYPFSLTSPFTNSFLFFLGCSPNISISIAGEEREVEENRQRCYIKEEK